MGEYQGANASDPYMHYLQQCWFDPNKPCWFDPSDPTLIENRRKNILSANIEAKKRKISCHSNRNITLPRNLVVAINTASMLKRGGPQHNIECPIVQQQWEKYHVEHNVNHRGGVIVQENKDLTANALNVECNIVTTC